MKPRHNNYDTSELVLEIYAFPTIKNINLKRTTLTNSGWSRGPNGDVRWEVNDDNDDGGGDRVHYKITCRTS